jgi:hypothetical protein
MEEKKTKWIFCYWDDCSFINNINKQKYKQKEDEKPEDCTSGEKSSDTGEESGPVLFGN